MRKGISNSALIALLAIGMLLSTTHLSAGDPGEFLPRGNRHSLLPAGMPPGAVGQARLMGMGPVHNYFQPVKFAGPEGVHFSLAQNGAFGQSEPSLMAGMLIGKVYRFQVTRIPGSEGAELYPTVEIIDRTYPPPGLATSYPIPLVLDLTDIEAALNGQMVTRVVYLEDPQTSIAIPGTPTDSRVMDIGYHQDPLEQADRLGRPVAIVRIGSVSPPRAPELLPAFFFGYPTWAPVFQPEQ